jgi:hypothetical protein
VIPPTPRSILTKQRVEEIERHFYDYAVAGRGGVQFTMDEFRIIRELTDFAFSALSEKREQPITDNDRRWRFLEHGCQWVSFIPINGDQYSFDPRVVSKAPGVGLTYMREVADHETEKHLAILREAINAAKR